MKGYNWEKDESNMWPAMLFHGDIEAHIYKTASPKKKKMDKYKGVMSI